MSTTRRPSARAHCKPASARLSVSFVADGAVIGRERELAALDEFLNDSRLRFACLALEGAPGMGKATLWEEAARRARDRGFVVRRSRPAPAETRLAFTGLTDLLAALPGETFAELPEPQRRALDVALLRTNSAGRPPQRRTIATALLSVVRGLAAAGMKNCEIATKLFMGRRIVEANLARAYAKLGIRSRAELGARLTRVK
jgi:hypothetical protein